MMSWMDLMVEEMLIGFDYLSVKVYLIPPFEKGGLGGIYP
jgi:hypothetical protein